MSTIAEERDKHLRKVQRKLDDLLDVLSAMEYEEKTKWLGLKVDEAVDLTTGALAMVGEILGEDLGSDTDPSQLELNFEEPKFPDTTELGEEDGEYNFD